VTLPAAALPALLAFPAALTFPACGGEAPAGGAEPTPVAPGDPAPAPGPGPVASPSEAAPGEPPRIKPVTVPTLLGEAEGVAFVGDWTSGPCGGRTYARNVRFESDNSYAVVDLVSPCPVGTTCMWSGVLSFAGEWRQDGTRLNLRELGINAASGPGGPHPVFFESTPEGKLVENQCLYERGLTVPPGFTEEKVRPRVPGR
jgi:hypothetical protein